MYNHQKFSISTTILLLCVSIINAASDNLIISPSTSEVVRFVNDSHIVTCSGDKGVVIHWKNPQDEIVTATKGRVHIEKTTSGEIDNVALVFKTINTTDTGNWFCYIEASDAKRSFRMVVNEPISFMDTPIFQNATENKDATIRCEAKGNPVPSVSWYYNGQQITLHHNKFTKLADGLLIKKVSKNETGEYTCKAYQISDSINEYDERTIKLIVHHKPIGVQKKGHPDVAFGYKNGYVNLTCIAEAEPNANFTWYRSGNKVLNPKQNKIFYGEHISMLQVYVNDTKIFGEYKCIAKNHLGTVEHLIILKEGTRPESPSKFDIKGFNSDSVSVDVGARKKLNPGAMDINGYRFELIPYEEYQEKRSWTTAHQYDYPTADGITYLITGLNHGTKYLIRAASRNPAGLSEFTETKEFATLSLRPPVVSGSPSLVIRSFSSTFIQAFIIIHCCLRIRL